MAISLSRLYDYIQCSLTLGVTPSDKWSIFWKETKNIRVRLGLEKHRPNEVYSLNTVYGKLYFRDNFGDITNLPDTFFYNVYGINRLKRDGVVLDIGANIGLVASFITFFNSGVQIHCFEPLADNVKMIRMNCPNAQVIQAALGAERGQISLEVDLNNVMASRISREHVTQVELFEVMTLDEYINEKGISKIALIKIDAEGMELDILNGASKTLEISSRMVMETHGYDRHNAATTLLKDAGYLIESGNYAGSTGMVYATNNEEETW